MGQRGWDLVPGEGAVDVDGDLPGFASATPFPQLTDREREVLELLATGLDNATIARRLSLSPKTVRNRVSDVLGKPADPRGTGPLSRLDSSPAVRAIRDRRPGPEQPPRLGWRPAGR